MFCYGKENIDYGSYVYILVELLMWKGAL